MAISRISGKILKANLERDDNLAFNTNSLVIDYTNNRVGIGTATPTTAFDVTGDVKITGNITTSGGQQSFDQIVIKGNKIESNVSNANLQLDANGTGIIELKTGATIAGSLTLQSGIAASSITLQSGIAASSILDEDSLSSNSATALATQQSIKAYVDAIDTNLLTDTTPQLGGNLDINGFNIVSARTNENINIIPSGTGVVKIGKNLQLGETVSVASIFDEDNFASNSATALATQQSIKAYVDASGSGVSTGMQITLGTPTDSSLTTAGAYQLFETSTKVTDAIDDLNEVTENIRNNTFVKSTTFTSNVVAGGAGFTATLTITVVGTANQHVINWGDGTSSDTTSSTSPTHTYSNFIDSPHTIQVTSSNTGGAGAGSSATFSRTDYITVYSPDPTVAFAAYAASSGGSAITSWDDGATIYFQNNSANTDITGASRQWTWDWGDSQSDNVISNDTDAGSQSGARIAHTFDTASESEQQFTVALKLDSMSTANPALSFPITASDIFEVYDAHTPTVTLDDNSGVNEEATSGHVVQLTNTTESGVGSQATYGITYQYQFGDGTSNVNVNAGSGSAGDRNQALSHTYALSSSDQSNGTARDYTGNLRVISNHTSSPFISSTFTVHVEPDVRANIAGTAVTVSTASGDNNKTIYNHTDLDSTNRAIVRATNTSQNADDYVYNWGHSSNDTVTENGSNAGSIGATLDHNYAGASVANYNLSFTANGTPDITAQTDVDTSITFNLKAVPSAPANLSAKSITLSDSSQGTSPKLASGFTDNTSSATTLAAGSSLSTTTARRYTSGTIDTSTASNFYNGAAGVLTAEINAAGDGAKTFTTAEGETGTFTSLVVSSNVDYDSVDGAYPQRFYLVASAKITKALSGYGTGLSAQRLTHSTTGNTNYVHVLKDNLTASPTFGSVGSLSAGTNGTFRYISGIPYYNSGSPTVNITGMTINNLVGQAYTDQANIVEVDSGTNAEGTSSNASNANDYTYANIDGSTTMLASGVPKVNIGTSSAYAIGSLSVPITSSSVRTIETIKARARNVNGISGYTELSTKLQVHTAAQSGVSEIAIPVADSLGATFDDDGVRIFDFNGQTTNTPSFSASTNFYTNSPYTESSDPGVAGTKEATVRLGVIEHNVVNYSTGFLPAGPNRSGDTGTQYFTFAFRRATVARFTINLTSSSGIAGMWYAGPGTILTAASGINGWVETTTQYAGVGLPGTDTNNGGNGSSGGAFTGADVIPTGSAISNQTYEMTLGTANLSNATNNVCLVRIALTSGQSISSLSIGTP